MSHALGRAIAVVGGALLLGVGCSSSDTSGGAVPADSSADVDYGDGPTTFRPDSDVPPDTRGDTSSGGDGGDASGDATGDAGSDAPTDGDGASPDAADGDAAVGDAADGG